MPPGGYRIFSRYYSFFFAKSGPSKNSGPNPVSVSVIKGSHFGSPKNLDSPGGPIFSKIFLCFAKMGP